MIALITRTLLFVQLLVAVLTGFAIHAVWPGLPRWLALSGGLICILLVRALITANNFRLAARFRDGQGAARLGWRRGIALYLHEFRATMTSSSWTMPFRQLGAVPTVHSGGLPVLLIHGYGCNSGYWWHFSRYLDAARISYHAVDLEPVLGDIDGYVPGVAAAIEALCAATGQPRVIIVAHSMGGLVARAFLRKHGQDRVARLITLGTPHDGTGLAQFGIGENARQMARRTNGTGQNAGDAPCCSAWLAALKATEPEQTHLVSIFSEHDNIIAPHTSCAVDGANNIVFTGVGHVALASDPAVIACLLEEIRTASRQHAAAHDAGEIR